MSITITVRVPGTYKIILAFSANDLKVLEKKIKEDDFIIKLICQYSLISHSKVDFFHIFNRDLKFNDDQRDFIKYEEYDKLTNKFIKRNFNLIKKRVKELNMYNICNTREIQQINAVTITQIIF
jgi:hypothetical protein